MLRHAIAVAAITLGAGLVPQPSAAQEFGAVQWLWCIARVGETEMYYSRVNAVPNSANRYEIEQRWKAELTRAGVTPVGSSVRCHREPTERQIASFRDWSLTAKAPKPLTWKEIPWTPE